MAAPQEKPAYTRPSGRSATARSALAQHLVADALDMRGFAAGLYPTDAPTLPDAERDPTAAG